MSTFKKPPLSFWIISIIALLWNIMGVYQYYLGNYELESLRDSFTAEEFAIFETMPSWYSIIFLIAVATGVLGSIALLLKKKAAVFLFLISLLTVLLVEIYWLLGTEIIEVSGISAAIMPIIVIAISIFLYFYSKGASQKGWLS